MKCSACQNNECERKYENRHKCVGKKEKLECSCTCQITAAEEITTTAISIGSGIGLAAAGVALTIMTGGLAAIIGGAALVGAGSSLVMTPIQKQITGESMTLTETAQDIALGATIGTELFISSTVIQCFKMVKYIFRCYNRSNWSRRVFDCQGRIWVGQVGCASWCGGYRGYDKIGCTCL